MEPTKRIILNTAVQYVRTFLSMIIMLVSTRILLKTLGDSDYGLYAVVGSTVFMIGFITVSLASSTQRFLSFSHGVGNKQELRVIFSNAFYLHLFIALLIATVMGILGSTFIGSLKISSDKVDAASFVYVMVLLMTLITFVTAPLRALFVARENILFVSIVEVIDALLKLLGTISLQYISCDSLKVYSVIMLSVSCFNLLAYAIYAFARYEECHIPSPRELSRSCLKKLTGFAVWNVYSVGSGVVRTQGLAVIVNHFLGTLVSAAYGISQQVYNAVSFIAMSILNAVNPQLMKAEGAGNRTLMLQLSTKESKYSFLMLSLLLIPLVMEMPAILDFWLDDVPEHAVMFCRFVLIAYIWDQTTIGLTSANQAIGKIRNYSLLISTTRLMTLPLAWLCLKKGYDVSVVMTVYLAIDVLIGFMRIPFLKVTGGLCVKSYCQEVYLRCFLPAFGILAISWLVTQIPDFDYRFVVTEVLSVLTGIALIYPFALTNSERDWIKQRVKRKR